MTTAQFSSNLTPAAPAAWSRARLYRLAGLAAAQVLVLLGIAALALAWLAQMGLLVNTEHYPTLWLVPLMGIFYVGADFLP
ncbi:MAG: hypothetical protein EOO59_20970, partial [Hymenobacter sp.]